MAAAAALWEINVEKNSDILKLPVLGSVIFMLKIIEIYQKTNELKKCVKKNEAFSEKCLLHIYTILHGHLCKEVDGVKMTKLNYYRESYD